MKNKKGFFFVGAIIVLVLFIVAIILSLILGGKVFTWLSSGGYLSYLKWGAIIVLLIVFSKPLISLLNFTLHKLGI